MRLVIVFLVKKQTALPDRDDAFPSSPAAPRNTGNAPLNAGSVTPPALRGSTGGSPLRFLLVSN